MPKVSVVIAVYNVEPYIERCLHSLFGQTLDEIEYIFVDDSSTDSSIKIINKTLEAYPCRKVLTKILHHCSNLGVGAARTTGIKAATGDYIIHCDPDDYIEVNMYEKLYSHAIETDADIVACYYWKEQQSQKEVVRINYSPTPQECLKNLYKKKHHCGHLWNKLVRRSLILSYDIFPFEKIDLAEDLNSMIRIYYWARTISVVEEPLYHYCIREKSLTTSDSYRRNFRTRVENVNRICAFLKQTGDHRYDTLCNYLKYFLKFDFRDFFTDDHEWFDWYRECHKDVMKYYDNSLKSRIILWIVLQNYTIYKFAKRIIHNL